jgi:predicted Zn-ribbon and HTH transcriptional regulator
MARPTSKQRTGEALPASQTTRQRIAELLRAEELTAHEISQRAAVQEREVADHLRHLEQTLSQTDERLHTVPPHCIKCGFAFDARQRHTRPSRCPRCKSERLSPPRFRIAR